MIKFYALGLSGYCTKVRMVLRIKNVPYEEVRPDGGHYSSAAYQERVPSGTIPAIELEAFTLFDSEAIVEFLEDRWPDPSMRSTDPQEKARQRALSQFHNTRLEPVVRKLFPVVKQKRNREIDKQVSQLKDSFIDQVEKLGKVLSPAPYIGGRTPCLADCGFPTTIRMGQDIFSHFGIEFDLPVWANAWMGSLEAHEIIGDEVQKNRAAIAKWLAAFK